MRLKSSVLLLVGSILLLIAIGIVFVSFTGSRGLAGTTDDQSPTAEPMVPVVVAELDIQEGTVITATDGLLKMDEISANQYNDQMHLTNMADAHTKVTNITIKAGEPVYKTSLREAGLAQKIPAPDPGLPALKAFPVQVNSLSGVADLIQPGDYVDVVASFNQDVVTLQPGVPQQGENGPVASVAERVTNEGIAKVLLQDIQVLDIVRPDAAITGEATPEPTPPPAPAEGAPAAPATAANTLKTGNWLLVVAVTNDEAEVLRFVLDRGIGITTILRRAGDHTTERTVGATMRILSEVYGMPMPNAPRVVKQPGTAVDGVPQIEPVQVPDRSAATAAP